MNGDIPVSRNIPVSCSPANNANCFLMVAAVGIHPCCLAEPPLIYQGGRKFAKQKTLVLGFNLSVATGGLIVYPAFYSLHVLAVHLFQFTKVINL